MKKLLLFLLPRVAGIVFLGGLFMLLSLLLRELVLQPQPFDTKLFIIFVLGCLCVASMLVALFYIVHELATENYKRFFK